MRLLRKCARPQLSQDRACKHAHANGQRLFTYYIISDMACIVLANSFSEKNWKYAGRASFSSVVYSSLVKQSINLRLGKIQGSL